MPAAHGCVHIDPETRRVCIDAYHVVGFDRAIGIGDYRLMPTRRVAWWVAMREGITPEEIAGDWNRLAERQQVRTVSPRCVREQVAMLAPIDEIADAPACVRLLLHAFRRVRNEDTTTPLTPREVSMAHETLVAMAREASL